MGDPASEKTPDYRSGSPPRARAVAPLAALLLLGMTGAVGPQVPPSTGAPSPTAARVPVLALYIPLADHSATLVAFERYRDPMEHADFQMPHESPAFIRGRSNRALPAAFEQSLPWADVVETGDFGHVAWYSKAEFWFTARFKRGSAPTAAAHEPGELSDIRVLVVDDNATRAC